MAASAFAQSGRRVRVHVPFDFVVAGRQMPAGDYTVRRVSKDSENTLVIQSEDGRRTAMVLTNSSRREAKRAELSFRQHGESYFLAEVSIPGTADVREVPRTKSEEKRVRELIEQAKSGGATDKTVTVVGSVQ
ncbi:MAG TPA: hypothetical protein VM914_00565 [Pyrinomonadaceae bacterium]|nr:hypothetical protein [Pyrinomonadaceae bacterium]